MAKKKKTLEEQLDANGRWVEEKGQVVGALRRVFRKAPQMQIVLKNARVELPNFKKDGSPAKRPKVRYRCAMCNELFQRKFVQVDHIEPVTPLHRSQMDMSCDELVDKIMCTVDNLQVLCSTPLKYNDNKPSCHKKKTDKENFVRRNWEEYYMSPYPIELAIEEAGKEYDKQFEEKERKRIERAKKKAERAAKKAKKKSMV